MYKLHKPPQKQLLSGKLINMFNCPTCSQHTHSRSIVQKLFEYRRKYPVVRGMASYGLVWPLCSVMQEYLANGTSPKNADWARAARYGIFGCFAMAPAWNFWMKLSGKMFMKKDLSSAIKRALFEQITYSPVALAFFFFGMSVFEKKPFSACTNEVKEKFWPTYSIGALFWPTAQTLNFYYVSEKNRLVCVTAASFVWTIFMAHMKEKEPKKENFKSLQDIDMPLMGNLNAAGMPKKIMNPIDTKSSSKGIFDSYFRFKTIDSDFSTEKIIFESGEYTESTDESKDSDDLQLVPEPKPHEFVISTEDFVATIGNAEITTENSHDITKIKTELPSEDAEDKSVTPGPSGDFLSNENEFAGYVNNDFTESNNNAILLSENLSISMDKTIASENLGNFPQSENPSKFKLINYMKLKILKAPIKMETENLNTDQSKSISLVDINQNAVKQDKNKQENEELHENNEEISTENSETEESSIETPQVVIIPVTETITSMTEQPKKEEAQSASENPENKVLQKTENDFGEQPLDYEDLYSRLGGMG